MHDFATKRNALFACLDEASSELKGTLLDQTRSISALNQTDEDVLLMNYRQGGPSRNRQKTSERTLQHLRGKESIFKKPELPIARCLKPRKLPDYQVNPHKWKKYSLEDVDISDHTNSTAAFEFLRQIDEQKESLDSSEIHHGEQTKIEFKRSCKIRSNLKALESLEQMDADTDSPKLKGSRLVMPEYVIGQKKPLIKKKSMNKFSTSNEKKERTGGKLILSHLEEDDEDEDNEANN